MSYADLPKVCIHLEIGECEVCARRTRNDKEKAVVEDHRLQNWKSWIKERKVTQKFLGKWLNRDSGELLMNTSEDYRDVVKEEKIVLDYTKILEPDPQRGCPGFWELPEALAEPCRRPPKYFSVKTKEQNCITPTINYVKIPDAIKLEKEIHQSRNINKIWEMSSYKKERLEALKEKISQIQPHKPILENIAIVGIPLLRQEEGNEFLPEVEAQENEEEHIPEDPYFLLNKLKIHPNSTGTKTIRISYDYDVDLNQLMTNYLKLENKSSFSIHFYWKHRKKFHLFRDIIKPSLDEPSFFFNRNPNVIIPGQTLHIPIWFKTEKTGLFHEKWIFVTEPKLGCDLELIIDLVGLSYVTDFDEKCQRIENRFEEALRTNIISETLSECVKRATDKKWQPIIYTYNKAKIFEAVNSHFDPLQRLPKYIYDKEVVKQLEDFYRVVKLPHHPQVWNLDIEDLRLATLERDSLGNKAEIRKAILSFLRISEDRRIKMEQQQQALYNKITTCEQKELLKAETSKKTDKEKSQKEKQAKGKPATDKKVVKLEPEPEPEPVDSSETQDPQTTLCRQLEKIIDKLVRPGTIPNMDQTKCILACSILVSHFDKLCSDLIELRRRLGITVPNKYPKLIKTKVFDRSSRFTCEYFNEYYFPKPKKLELILNCKDKPPPDILKDIPMDECARRYRAYYNIPEPTEEVKKMKGKKEKGGKKGTDKRSKEKKSEKKSAKEKKSVKEKKGGKSKGKQKSKTTKSKGKKEADVDTEKNSEDSEIDEPFDPYKVIDVEKKVVISDFVDEEYQESPVPLSVVCQYRYNLYIYFYTYLDLAIQRITEMVDSVTYYDFPLPDVKKVDTAEKLLHEDFKNKTRYINLKSIIDYIEEEGDISVIEEDFIKSLQDGLQIKRMPKPVPVNEFIDKDVPMSALCSVFQTYKPRSESIKSISHPCEMQVKQTLRVPKVTDAFTETFPPEALDDWSRYIDVETQTEKPIKSAVKLEVCFSSDNSQESLPSAAIQLQQIDTKMTLIEKAVKTVAYHTHFPAELEISKNSLVKHVMKVISSKSNKSKGSDIECGKVDSKMFTIHEAMKIYTKIGKSAIKKHYKKEKIQKEKCEKAEELGYLVDYVSDEDYFYSDSDSECDTHPN